MRSTKMVCRAHVISHPCFAACQSNWPSLSIRAVDRENFEISGSWPPSVIFVDRPQRAKRMWNARIETLPDCRGLRFAIVRESRPSTFAEIIRAWQSDADFRSQFNALLADAPYSAF